MRHGVHAGLIFIALVLQTTLMQSLLIFGVKADLLCTLLVALAIVSGPYPGAMMGGISGLVYDLLFMRPGFYAVQYLLIGLFGGLLPGKLRFGKYVLPVMVCFTLVTGKELLQLAYLFFMRVEINFSVAITKMLLGGVYTAALMIPVYLGIRMLSELPFMRPDYQGEENRL